MKNYKICGNTISAKSKEKTGDYFHYEQIGDYLVMVVADGVGSCDCDWYASELATKTFYHAIKEKITSKQIEIAIAESIEEANLALLMNKYSYYLATTFVVAAFNTISYELNYVSIGDSRMYLYVNNKTCPFTNDEVEFGLINDGVQIKPRQYLINCVGNAKLKFTVQSKILKPGDGIILCTDGFHTIREHALENELDFVMNNADLYSSFQKLFNWYAGYRKDDMTLVIGKIHPETTPYNKQDENQN